MTTSAPIQQEVLSILANLPLDKQREVLAFVQGLQCQEEPKQPRPSLKGILSHLEINLSEEDLRQVWHEMWANFPREMDD